MGAVFGVPYTRAPRWPGALTDLVDSGFEVLALTPASDAVALDEVSYPAEQRLAVVLGTEGAGLSEAATAVAGQRIRIPMMAGIDSLNVAAAAAVAFWALGRR
jgi:tRNA G18 (ribose-2'-O)-methylase SpoU